MKKKISIVTTVKIEDYDGRESLQLTGTLNFENSKNIDVDEVKRIHQQSISEALERAAGSIDLDTGEKSYSESIKLVSQKVI